MVDWEAARQDAITKPPKGGFFIGANLPFYIDIIKTYNDMTTEQFAFLQSIETHLLRALESNYCRYMPHRDMQRIVDILKEHNPSLRVNLSCSRCKLSLLRDAARLYLAERDKPTIKSKSNGKRSNRKSQNSQANEGRGTTDE